MRRRVKIKTVKLKYHDTETSLLEGILSRGDRRIAEAVELAWRRGSRMESWTEQMKPNLWWDALRDCNINIEQALHQPYELIDRLPWDHINVKKGRTYLEKEHERAVVQLASMADAV
jgi:hypothetical protein